MASSHRLLVGRRAVVTGAARGIGRTVAERFAAEGAEVLLGDVDEPAASAAAAEIGARGGTAYAAAVDVTDPASVAALAEAADQRMGGADVVVANAGVLLQAAAIDTEPADWERVLRVNLTGAFLTCREFGRRMIERGVGGRVILSASLFGVRGGRDNAAYAATKFGMVGLAQCLAAEWAPYGVLVNAVCPGQVDTAMMRQLVADRSALRGVPPAAVEAEIAARIPAGRLAVPEEIADVYVFLASELSRYVTGQAVVVDGGWLVG